MTLEIYSGIVTCVLAMSFLSWVRLSTPEWKVVRERLAVVLSVGAILMCFVAVGVAIGRTVPVTEHRVVQTTLVDERVHKIRKDVQPVVSDIYNGDIDKLCSGDPIVIETVGIGQVEGRSETQILGHAPNTRDMVSCHVDGDYADFWKKGMVIRMPDSGARY